MKHLRFLLVLGAFLVLAGLFSAETSTASAPSGAIFTTLEDGSVVNANIYPDKRDVYLDGGPPQNAPSTAAGLDPGNYYFQVTDPSGKKLLSSDPVICREVHVNAAGVIDQDVSAGRTYNGNKPCNKDGWKFGKHDTGVDVDHSDVGAITVQLMPYDNTPNPGGVYKAWATPVGSFVGDPNKVDNPCGSGCFHGFLPSASKTDNFKVKGRVVPPRIEILKWYDYNRNGVEEVGTAPNEVWLPGWKVLITDPLGVTTIGYTPVVIDPADEGTYHICEDQPVEPGWTPTTPVCVDVAVAGDQSVTVKFGNVYKSPFAGGLTMGYWKTHTGLDSPDRDPTYDQLPITLGVAANGISSPEVVVASEAIARDVLTVAGDGCSGDCLAMLKAQLLAAKLNCLAFPGFCDATYGLSGPTVQSVIAAADQLLDDVANGVVSGEDAIKAIAEPLASQLDTANNNSHTPVLFAISPIPGPYSFA